MASTLKEKIINFIKKRNGAHTKQLIEELVGLRTQGKTSRGTLNKTLRTLYEDRLIDSKPTTDGREKIWMLADNYQQIVEMQQYRQDATVRYDIVISKKQVFFKFYDDKHYQVETIYDLFSFINSPLYTKQMWSLIDLPSNPVQIAMDNEPYHSPQFTDPDTKLFKKFIIPIFKGHHIYKIKYQFNIEPNPLHSIELHFPVKTLSVSVEFDDKNSKPTIPYLLIPCDEKKEFPLTKQPDGTYNIILTDVTPLTPITLYWN